MAASTFAHRVCGRGSRASELWVLQRLKQSRDLFWGAGGGRVDYTVKFWLAASALAEKNKSPGYPLVVETAFFKLGFSSPKWLMQPLPLKKFESLNSKRGRETLRRKGKGSGKSLGQIGNARYEGKNSPLLPFHPPDPSLSVQCFTGVCCPV